MSIYEDMKNNPPPRLTGVWNGIVIPDDVIVFDVRRNYDSPELRYWPSDVWVELALGWAELDGEHYVTVKPSDRPLSLQVPARLCENEEEATATLARLLELFQEKKAAFEAAGPRIPDHPYGGTAHHPPVGITLNNFGGDVFGDGSVVRIKYFEW